MTCHNLQNNLTAREFYLRNFYCKGILLKKFFFLPFEANQHNLPRFEVLFCKLYFAWSLPADLSGMGIPTGEIKFLANKALQVIETHKVFQYSKVVVH